jgi:SOS-response transcriptional repressor LexA
LKNAGLNDSQILNLQDIISEQYGKQYEDSLDAFISTLSKESRIVVLDVLKDMINHINAFSKEQSELAKALKTEAEETLKNLLTFKNTMMTTKNISHIKSQLYMCPVYGRISAGQPNWAEECIEAKIPLDVEIMNIHNPEECFFLRVIGESMNKVVKNGGYALIHKQEDVENGDIAVVLVNGYDATLKKFSKKNDRIILEPMSNDPNFEIQLYDESTYIKILGKYIGKFEMN